MSTAEPGSFRDPSSRVFYEGGEVRRGLSGEGVADFEALAASGLLADPRIVGTERAEREEVLRHERVPFVSYPYEWTFSMLKDAALLQLDLQLAALDHGLGVKDASPYNVQFAGTRPVFIDVGSFERLRPGDLWTGYRQFCMLPLLLHAHKGVRFQPWLRGSIDGITATETRALMSVRDRFRRGLTTNVFLQARLEQRDSRSSAAITRQVRSSGAERALIGANVRKMRKLVDRLDWTPPRSTWVDYGEQNTYEDADAQRKDAFVRAAVASRRWQLVWDLGANNGRHAKIAADGARSVVALDADEGAVELLYRKLRDAGDTTVLPLTVNLADPSPGLGWRGRERKTLLDRGRPELVLALALVHHIVIAANVPLSEFVDWLAELGAALVIEFPTREDPMVQRLLSRKRQGLHADYDRAAFERRLGEAFEIQRTEVLGSGTRVLYFATLKGSH